MKTPKQPKGPNGGKRDGAGRKTTWVTARLNGATVYTERGLLTDAHTDVRKESKSQTTIGLTSTMREYIEAQNKSLADAVESLIRDTPAFQEFLISRVGQ